MRLDKYVQESTCIKRQDFMTLSVAIIILVEKGRSFLWPLKAY
jgi:hypothetical protein